MSKFLELLESDVTWSRLMWATNACDDKASNRAIRSFSYSTADDDLADVSKARDLACRKCRQTNNVNEVADSLSTFLSAAEGKKKEQATIKWWDMRLGTIAVVVSAGMEFLQMFVLNMNTLSQQRSCVRCLAPACMVAGSAAVWAIYSDKNAELSSLGAGATSIAVMQLLLVMHQVTMPQALSQLH